MQDYLRSHPHVLLLDGDNQIKAIVILCYMGLQSLDLKGMYLLRHHQLHWSCQRHTVLYLAHEVHYNLPSLHEK